MHACCDTPPQGLHANKPFRPDSREIVEVLLLEWERRGEEPGTYPGDIRPDINAIRRLLSLTHPAP
jgi:hypothetical protein